MHYTNIKKHAAIYFFILAGIILRLIFPGDMEWKVDEKWMYEKAHYFAATNTLPEAGMQSGGGLVNPGMSVAVFALIAKFTDDPLAMNRVVQFVNIAAILCFLLFALYRIEEKERSVWLWGIALASVSPLAVLFSRKIWAQDLLPIITFVIIYASYYRRKPWASFVWGLSGALIGQIHMSGFFFAGGLFLFTVVHDYYNKIKFHWFYWLLGSLAGAITIIPWIQYMIEHPQFTRQSYLTIFQLNFFIYWFIDSQGLNIMYSIRQEFWQFIKEPYIAGTPTYLIAVLHLFLVVVSAFTVIKVAGYFKAIFLFIKNKRHFKSLFIGLSTTKFYLYAILLGLGVLMTLSFTVIQPHYLICAFPFTYIFLAKVLQNRKRILLSIIIAQLILTFSYLLYVHANKGIPQGDYGVTYQEQVK